MFLNVHHSVRLVLMASHEALSELSTHCIDYREAPSRGHVCRGTHRGRELQRKEKWATTSRELENEQPSHRKMVIEKANHL
jgi:hypothetical protein